MSRLPQKRVRVIIWSLFAFATVILPQKSRALGSRLIGYAQYYVGNTVGTYDPTDSQHYFYPDAFGLLDSSRIDYIVYAGTFQPRFRYVYSYNSAEQIAQYTTFQWDSVAHVYLNLFLLTYTYNASGYRTNVLEQQWSASLSSWYNLFNKIYTLNGANQLIDETDQQWNSASSSWTPYYHYTYTLNAQGNPTQKIIQQGVGANWVNSRRYDYTYDASDTHVLQETDLNWITSSSSWLNINRNVYTLNASGAPSQMDGLGFSLATQTFLPFFREIFSYDASGNQTLLVENLWDTSTSAYSTPYVEEIQTYNADNQVLSYNTLVWSSGAYSPEIGSTRRLYYYENYNPSGVHPVAQADAHLSVFPIPATNALNISLKWEEAQDWTGSISDMQGKICFRFAGPTTRDYHSVLSLNDLPAGIYTLSVIEGKGSSISRMIEVRK